jgi:ribosome-associated protein
MPTIEFELTRDHIELNQLLKVVGLCDSGGAGKKLVADGLVQVDGQPESRKTAKIRAGQVVTCGDARIVVGAQATIPAARGRKGEPTPE